MTKRIGALLLVGLLSTPLSAEVVDQRDPTYQRMMDHLSSMRQALSRAQHEAEQAERNSTLVNFNFARLRADISAIERQVERLLMPRKERLRYHRLQPDSIYFLPKQDAPSSQQPNDSNTAKE